MANPPITIGPFTNVPAPGSPIASAWAQQLTQAFVDDDKVLRQAPVPLSGAGGPGNVDATSTNVFTTWLNIGTPLAPAWATKVDVQIWVLGIDVIVADVDYMVRPVCNAPGQEYLASGILGKRFQLPMLGRFAVTGGVVNNVTVECRRVGGTGGFRYTSGSAITGLATFRP